MSRRRADKKENEPEVRGPNSALTAFLREQGIDAGAIRRRYEQSLLTERNEQTSHLHEQEEPFQENEIILAAIEKRRRRRTDANSDSGYSDSSFSSDDVKDSHYCMNCDREFKITVYSKKLEKDGKVGYLCTECTRFQVDQERRKKKTAFEARKKRKKLASALLNRQELKIPSLQDICIKLLSKHIDDVHALGDISVVSLNKISRILSKNRSLNNRTMMLFLDVTLKHLEFWDCSNIDMAYLDKITAFCPKLESMTLNMCGQLHNSNLISFAQNLLDLNSIVLNGPFLISEPTWVQFFELMNARLKLFHVSNTHRFSGDSLQSLLTNCGTSLESLSLSRLDGLMSKAAYDVLPYHLRNLKHLDLSNPFKENLIDDNLIMSILSVNGESIETLLLDGCSGLTDLFLVKGVKRYCSSLKRISLESLDQVTDSGLTQLFGGWTINSGLIEVNLKRCFGLGDRGILTFLNHSASSLVSLNLNSVYSLSHTLFQTLSRTLKLPLLTALDLGFVRSVDDKAIAILSRICPKLKELEVYGNNRCTQRARIRRGLKVLGRQSDSI
ncbi:DNA repair protein [Komagataella phaffii CBS 7435]|uniref:Protein that recognizes and binds damaged DNA in an ATP-dependent manner (With Rad16p) n=2 Tax=Komagataella phaffii TaxID=460519 RepID=C4R1U2_KOMPG|nr:Protein that recognizes and binds damaged DNA in an ATP-dependent manner (with Rad16p) [Komagataella phaffii GS115]AOA62361.1 GQ67_00882T0 [Komagataella phaffii]CAH2447995.1 DNA repair protein [Komagataella phaffii CBS 7435]AOA67966.1 GQ68_00507T0 [Komagataella phaffii GS115]CAY69466.1 Protein that recognizes and binds damaged DNA in an ATP-dependent manner (with Rad16p) [Komagataella phaffii GS115]CCA38151.1 DNA repair protein [Komagataella phaffii CBS 7435]